MKTYTLYAWRNPTPEEIRFGYGCRHYSTFTLRRRTVPKRFKWVGNWWYVKQLLEVKA